MRYFLTQCLKQLEMFNWKCHTSEIELDSPHHPEPRCKLHLQWQFPQSVLSWLLQRVQHIQPTINTIVIPHVWLIIAQMVNVLNWVIYGRSENIPCNARWQTVCLYQRQWQGRGRRNKPQGLGNQFVNIVFFNPLDSGTCPCKESQIEEVSDESKNLACPRGDLGKAHYIVETAHTWNTWGCLTSISQQAWAKKRLQLRLFSAVLRVLLRGSLLRNCSKRNHFKSFTWGGRAWAEWQGLQGRRGWGGRLWGCSVSGCWRPPAPCSQRWCQSWWGGRKGRQSGLNWSLQWKGGSLFPTRCWQTSPTRHRLALLQNSGQKRITRWRKRNKVTWI